VTSHHRLVWRSFDRFLSSAQIECSPLLATPECWLVSIAAINGAPVEKWLYRIRGFRRRHRAIAMLVIPSRPWRATIATLDQRPCCLRAGIGAPAASMSCLHRAGASSRLSASTLQLRASKLCPAVHVESHLLPFIAFRRPSPPHSPQALLTKLTKIESSVNSPLALSESIPSRSATIQGCRRRATTPERRQRTQSNLCVCDTTCFHPANGAR
jgi:hypothetical protein